jgi:hypothetical protein
MQRNMTVFRCNGGKESLEGCHEKRHVSGQGIREGASEDRMGACMSLHGGDTLVGQKYRLAPWILASPLHHVYISRKRTRMSMPLKRRSEMEVGDRPDHNPACAPGRTRYRFISGSHGDQILSSAANQPRNAFFCSLRSGPVSLTENA